MNRIKTLFENKNSGILSIFMTAGYPSLNDTAQIIETLSSSGVDMIEIGIPFSDPVADGPVIQNSSKIALQNGMSISLLFEQLRGIRDKTQLPLILMGYINPIMQYGIEEFCRDAVNVGIDGFIIPDLPINIYKKEWKEITEKYNLDMVFLITQETTEERIRSIDSACGGFIYMVTSAGTTGGGLKNNDEQINYFKRVREMKLENRVIAGFGVRSRTDLDLIGEYAHGAIVGSHFIESIGKGGNLEREIVDCIEGLRGSQRKV